VVFPNLIEIGPLTLPTYATLLSLGLVGGVFVNLRQAPRWGVTQTQCFDATLLAAAAGLIGARLAYIAVNWAYFHNHLAEALRLWAGGLAWQGGLVLALCAVVLYAARYRLPLSSLFDALTLGLAWFTLFVWLGSGVANDVFGRETYPTDGLLWRLSADLPDLYGLRAPRVNVPLLGIIWSGLVFLGLGLSRARFSGRGAFFFTYLTLTGLGGLVLVLLQANAVPILFHVRIDGWFYLIVALFGLGGLFALRLRTTRAKRQSAKVESRTTHA
jgi:phosphatidylglycerol:prolipoprotein diacylglycerol transferase